MCLPFILSACATNKGDFGLEDVHAPQSEPQKPKFQDEKTQPRTEEEVSAFMQPGLGASIEIPRRGTGLAGTLSEERVALTPENIKRIGGDLDIPYVKDIKNHNKYTGSLIHSHDNSAGDHRKRDLEYVRSGWVADANVGLDFVNGEIGNGITRKVLFGSIGHVYYKGVQPAQAFPTSGKATYKGTWDFVTDARQGRAGTGFTGTAANVGSNYGAVSFNEYDSIHTDKSTGEVGHSSELEVDFANKSLTGTLYKNHKKLADKAQERTPRYKVKADIKGNRFQGRVEAGNKDDLYFGKDGNLEGGFFGPAAEELAGKFLADDNSLFGVLAGKREKAADEKTDKIIDAYHIDFKNLNLTQADNFGDARKFVFKGQTFSLLPAAGTDTKSFLETLKYALDGNRTLNLFSCCSNLDYLKFGTFQTATGEDKDGASFFFQGERTPVKDIPTGTAHYKGSWQAHIISKTGHVWSESPNNKEGGSRAEFDVDFGAKTLKGKLTAQDRALPTFNIHAQIEGNGFTGRAKTRDQGFILDPGSTANSVSVHLDAEVKGGFYGPKAAELGGVFHSNEEGKDKVGGSFGAKRQISVQ
ncbi:transferrin-binding protein-like solute binding protein [Neisseria weaveri]|uniref:transferrin-binding protein-like solute binding protein n=1 Tax=Neisseria weaveri TaxID=28091 RepID=UPI0002231A58|nr:transferrin-binding protein-like solute binding protein [Neisseria weaveri]EGV35932.1 hypothetical protein l13_12720 [Neisseria weaveri ATCC 51223]